MQAIEANERALKEKGVAWDTPSVTTSLRQVPFFEGVPEGLFREVVLQVPPLPRFSLLSCS